MDTQQIDSILRRRCSSIYKGTFASDELLRYNFDSTTSDALFVVNTAKESHPGIHWVGVYIGRDHGFYFDSYGRAPEAIIEHFMIKHCYDDWYFNDRQIQSIVSSTCVAYAIQFVIFMEKYRFDFTKMLRLYTTDTALNDVIVLQFLRSL